MNVHDRNTARTAAHGTRSDEATDPGQSEHEEDDAVIAEGDRAPDFQLPGRRGSDARLFRLHDDVRRGAVLLLFCRDGGTNGDVAEAIAPWFQFDGVRVWVVASEPSLRSSTRPADGVPGAATLVDVDESVADRYSIDAPSSTSNPAVVLVDRSRTVRFARRMADPFDSEAIDVLRRTIDTVRTPQENPA